MSLALPYTRAVLTNRSLWFWAVLFMIFWFILGAYVFSQGLATDRASEVAYTSAWYAVIVLFAMSTLAVAIAGTIEYGSSALAFGFRYTRLTPFAYAIALMAGMAAMALLLGFVLAGAVSGLFSAHFGTVILPANLPGIVGVSILTGVFMMGLATTLVVVVVNYVGLRNMSFVGFIPLVFSYLFGFAQLFVALPTWGLYLSPWNDIESLLYQGYSGSPATAILGSTATAALDWPVCAAALGGWVVVFAITSTLLLRRIRSVSIEEARQV